jgi:hypothetical protein
MPPPPSSPPLKHGKSTDLKHKREQNEREQNFTTKRKKFKNPVRNKKPRTAKKEKKNKHRDYSGSKKKTNKGNRHTRRKKLGN